MRFQAETDLKDLLYIQKDECSYRIQMHPVAKTGIKKPIENLLMIRVPEMRGKTRKQIKEGYPEDIRLKRIILFGAGASTPFYEPSLTTQLLTDRLSDAAIWTDLIGRFNVKMNGAASVHGDLVIETINRIRSLNADISFEGIVEIIDKVSSFSFGGGWQSLTHTTQILFS